MRTKKPTSTSGRTFSIRLAPEIVERVEAHAAKVKSAHPTFTISDSDVVRDLLVKGLEAAHA
jgi:hypothetical protein